MSEMIECIVQNKRFVRSHTVKEEDEMGRTSYTNDEEVFGPGERIMAKPEEIQKHPDRLKPVSKLKQKQHLDQEESFQDVEYGDFVKSKLKEIAEDRGIEKFEDLSKSELIDVLEETEEQ